MYKKRVALGVVLALTLVVSGLAACGMDPVGTTNTANAAATDEQAKSLRANTMSKAELAERQFCEAHGRNLTLRDLVDDYLSGAGELSALYNVYGDGDQATMEAFIPSTQQGAYLVPGAAFPEAEWSSQAVRDSYYDESAPWAKHRILDGYAGWPVLYSQDYEYQFMIDPNGWLRVNGWRSLPPTEDRATMAASMLPKDLMAAYRSGDWDGESYLWSADYSTQVRINSAGELAYLYQTQAPYYANYNPRPDYIYQGYDAEPWWVDGLAGYDVKTVDSTHFEGNLVSAYLHVKCDEA